MIADAPTGPTIDHASYLGASDIGVIVDVSHMARDASDVWGEKKGYLHFEGDTATEIGNAVERPILAVWAAARDYELHFPGTMLHPVEKWAGATPDMIVQPRTAGEFKMVGGQMARAWGPEHLGEDGVPDATVCQLHWQVWILRANGIPIDNGVIVACFGTEIRTYEIEINDNLIDALVDEGREWWETYVVADVRPEGRAGRELVAAIHPANVRKELDEMTEKVRGLCLAYDEARTREKTGDQAMDAIGAILCELIGKGSGFEDKTAKVTWKADKNKNRSLRVVIRKQKE